MNFFSEHVADTMSFLDAIVESAMAPSTFTESFSDVVGKIIEKIKEIVDKILYLIQTVIIDKILSKFPGTFQIPREFYDVLASSTVCANEIRSAWREALGGNAESAVKRLEHGTVGSTSERVAKTRREMERGIGTIPMMSLPARRIEGMLRDTQKALTDTRRSLPELSDWKKFDAVASDIYLGDRNPINLLYVTCFEWLQVMHYEAYWTAAILKNQREGKSIYDDIEFDEPYIPYGWEG